MFQLKNFVSIAASMLNYVRSTTGKVTDLQPGSVTRTILEAPATEIEELYVQMFNGIKEAIPVAIYNSIKFDKLPAQFASGRVTVTAKTTATADLKVPVGTRFLTQDGRIYVTVRDATWPANQTQYTFAVLANLAGVSMNAAADQIVSSTTFPPDRYTINSSVMTGGSDIESDDSRDIRFADYIASLSRGTEAAILYGARSTYIKDEAGNILESVVRTALTALSGSVTVFIWGSNGAPSDALLTAVNTTIAGYRKADGTIVPGYSAAGVRCEVQPMAATPVNATYKVTLSDGTAPTTQLQVAIKNALDTRLYQVMPGQTITVEEMRVAILNVPNIMAAELLGVNNIVCGNNQILTAGLVVAQ